MKNPKPNISLKNFSDLRNSGLFLSLKKGLNEIFHRQSVKLKASKSSCRAEYQDIISVIICTANRSPQLTNAVNSVLNQSLDPDKYEIILVNNSDTKISENAFPDRVNITDEPIIGLSKARNSGAAAAKGEYLLYIDDDAEADENLLSSIYCSFKEHQKISIIGGQIFLRLPTPAPEVFLEGRESVWSGYTAPYKQFRQIHRQYEFPYGACFAVRHTALDALGGFPEAYGRRGNDFAGGEETALCFKALSCDFKIGIEPKAWVHHCVLEERFSKEHIRRTLYEGITTTYRLCKEGYAPYKWTPSYINERIKILRAEISRLKKQDKALAVFYKECELDAFSDIAKSLDFSKSGRLFKGYNKNFIKMKAELFRKHPLHSADLRSNFVRGLVSVVLPVYNCEKYLEESILSVLSQTYTNFELIIVDDGSTDSSGSIADSYIEKDSRIRVIHQGNMKLPNALNTGFAAANGEFLTWTSADNRMLPICLETLTSELLRDRSCDMVFANMRLIDENGDILKGYGWYEKPPLSGNVILPDDTSCLNTRANNTIGAAFMYRAGADKVLNGYSERLYTLEDYDYFMRMNYMFSIRHTLYKRPVYEYRIHKESLTSRDAELGITKSRPALMELDQKRRIGALKPVFFYADGAKPDKITIPGFYRVYSKAAVDKILSRGKVQLIYINFGSCSPTIELPDHILKFLIMPEPTENAFGYDVMICENSSFAENSRDWVCPGGNTALWSFIYLRAKNDKFHLA